MSKRRPKTGTLSVKVFEAEKWCATFTLNTPNGPHTMEVTGNDEEEFIDHFSTLPSPFRFGDIVMTWRDVTEIQGLFGHASEFFKHAAPFFENLGELPSPFSFNGQILKWSEIDAARLMLARTRNQLYAAAGYAEEMINDGETDCEVIVAA